MWCWWGVVCAHLDSGSFESGMFFFFFALSTSWFIPFGFNENNKICFAYCAVIAISWLETIKCNLVNQYVSENSNVYFYKIKQIGFVSACLKMIILQQWLADCWLSCSLHQYCQTKKETWTWNIDLNLYDINSLLVNYLEKYSTLLVCLAAAHACYNIKYYCCCCCF